jgi:hypothetical protein
VDFPVTTQHSFCWNFLAKANMKFMSVTAAVFQLPIGWLNALGSRVSAPWRTSGCR